MLSTVIQLLGFALLALAGFRINIALGEVVAGVSLLLIGHTDIKFVNPLRRAAK